MVYVRVIFFTSSVPVQKKCVYPVTWQQFYNMIFIEWARPFGNFTMMKRRYRKTSGCDYVV
jgi:hypothetical protein